MSDQSPKNLKKKKSAKKQALFIVAKVAIAGILIGWLIQSDRLNPGQLKVFLERPELLVIVVLVWVFGTIGLGGTRWYLLMRGMGLKPRWGRVLQLTAIGSFFNSLMPGAVGGDLIRAVYIFKDETNENRNVAMLTVLLDRVLGLLGLFTTASIGVALGAGFVFSQPELIVPGIIALAVPIVVIGASLPVIFRFERIDNLAQWFSGLAIPGSTALVRLYEAVCRYRQTKRFLAASLGLSVLIQGIVLFFYWYLAEVFSGREISVSLVASVLPIGILLTTIPLAPGGLGVGHVAFDRLFELAGIGHGADIFNVVFIGQIVMNMFGVIPYIFFKSRLPSPVEVMAQEEEEAEDFSHVSPT